METDKISFHITTSDAECPFGIEIWLDDTILLKNNHVQEQIIFSHAIGDNVNEHDLQIKLFGKTLQHTQIDASGKIVKDAILQISNVTIGEIDIDKLFWEKCVYTHDFNGTKHEIADKFYGQAGCNGTISFIFSTPIYLWLLENM